MASFAWYKYGKQSFLQSRPGRKLGVVFFIILAILALFFVWLFVNPLGSVAARQLTAQTEPAATQPSQQPASVTPPNRVAQDPPIAKTANTTSISATTNGDKRSVTINGKSVAVPADGTVHRTIKNDAGNSTVDVSVSSHSSQTASESHLNVNIDSSSSTTEDSQ